MSENTPLTWFYAFINDGNEGVSTRAPNGWVGVLRTGERRAATGRQTARMRPRRTEPMDEPLRLQPSRARAGECRPTDPQHHAAGRLTGRQAETVGCSRAAGRALGRSVGSAAQRRMASAVDPWWVGVGVSGLLARPARVRALASLSACPPARTDIRPSDRASGCGYSSAPPTPATTHNAAVPARAPKGRAPQSPAAAAPRRTRVHSGLRYGIPGYI